MGRREDIEEQLQKDYELLKKLEDRLRTETDPRLELRWTEGINKVKQRIHQREEELRSVSIQPEPIIPVTPKPQKRIILLLSANPMGTSKLRLDEEMREIKEGLRRAKQREQYEIDTAEAVRYRDIHRAILDYEPNIVHFSGHGAGEEGLVFEDETGHTKLVDAEALAGLFELFADQVECVVLNACYSEVQAQEIAQHINYVIGMSQAIGDRAAIEFAVGFYDALGAGRPVEFAHRLGCNVIRMAGIPENLTPQLLTKNHAATLSPSSQSDEVELRSERGVNYTQLHDLLAAGKWREADEETARVMLQAADREKSRRWLRPEDIDGFPCTDLRTIDQLWVKYSDRRFGFSVQKRIWLEVSGQVDYQTELALGYRVGWLTDERPAFFDYNSLTFDLSAPVGHLPCVFDFNATFWHNFSDIARAAWVGLWTGHSPLVGISSLAWRVVTCNI